jgi:Mn-dependent DtxR family transcriptional regulator
MTRDMIDADESMAAIKPDGSLTQTARDVLRVCDPPATEEDIARALVRHFSQVQPMVRELISLGLLEDVSGRLVLTDFGQEKVLD